MGAWGHGAFENDSALDWLADLAEGDASLVAEALAAVADADADEYIEVDDASAALVAAELVAAALGKGDDRLNDDATSWLDAHRASVRDLGAAGARRAVARVLESSELSELWGENGDDTPWHLDVRALLERLG